VPKTKKKGRRLIGVAGILVVVVAVAAAVDVGDWSRMAWGVMARGGNYGKKIRHPSLSYCHC
jgi:hypothetical protein